MSSTLENLFARMAACGLSGIHEGDVIAPVAGEAQPFVAACLTRSEENSPWIVCQSVREQEDFAAELAEWIPGARIFPELPPAGDGSEILLDPETAAERTEILTLLGRAALDVPLVLHAAQLEEEVPDPAGLVASALVLRAGDNSDPVELVRALDEAGYERATQVAFRGQYAVRGGIIDLYSRQAASPLRVEFEDVSIASLREFDPDTQLSRGEIPQAEVLLSAGKNSRFRALRTLHTSRHPVLSVGETPCLLPCANLRDGPIPGTRPVEFFELPFGPLAAGDLALDTAVAGNFFRQLTSWLEEGWMVLLAAGSEGEFLRFREFCREKGFDAADIEFLPLALTRGFVAPAARVAVLPDAALFGRSAFLRANRSAARRHRAAAGRAAADFSEFEEGELVVHLEEGIGKFLGIVPSPDGNGEDVLAIEFARESRLYVPIAQAWQVSRYAGLGRGRPELSELGSTRWQKAKEKAVASVFDYASRMLRVQAERESLSGHAFGPDTHWQGEFEEAFPHKETADQLRATAETKRDMESSRPMDRLVCGDVGFGKTEVAVRAIFKAVMGGKQAALLAPTTVLARQHFETLSARMSDFPVTLALLNRYRSAAEQRRILRGLSDGSIDVVVGTHRLVSPDVAFKDIGLVVVDEEQRFGVKHKDILKERFRQVDVLTLSATPIPRTLYMALVGARDMSLIETPPPNRQPVETIVCAYDERVLRDAIERELARGGQVFVLHNRVRTIGRLAERIGTLCPAARIAVGHGQMEEGELEPVMESFVAGKTDVLVSTTIIESGLDIPNANTIIIDRADLFGMADLYQLRGRVGRSGAKAYAYLMLPRDLMGAARRRVSAIKQYSGLGSGFKIAMRDLELRGAGNMLGTAQSGHILAVGFDLYCRMLRRAVDAIAGKKRFTRAECAVRIDFVVNEEPAWLSAPEGTTPAFVPHSYVGDAKMRIACYRQLAEAEEHPDLEKIQREWRDRFGPLPRAAANAILIARIAIAAAARRLTSVETRDGRLQLSRRTGFIQPGGKFPRLTASDPDSRLREILELIEKLEE